ncbi:MAG: FAD-dependent oxidoreductase [Gammaproteobacteria bacterium]|nr:FAD-dependent oxidoreductase [Gammaproteobacteria bacterium]MYH46861.1 FAD-dependent oxidoreductase [Gammaproteobacteria bacterium]MYL13539.1 FAD-dependent oxidoreductase [Gammaproteobacteria bacterium]
MTSRPGAKAKPAEPPRRAGVIVIGGGVIGCSVAYHLARDGVADVVLLERRQLTSGTTWHAAGLVGQLRTSVNMTALARYTSELYLRLEEETGQATGYRRCGSISLATNEERFEELRRSASMAKVFGLNVQVLKAEEINARVPLLNVEDVLGGIHIPSDGYANAVDVTNALAKGATAAGARIFQNTPVTAILTEGGRIAGVATDRGEIDADCVVLCAGMWTRELAASIGVNVPLHACEHYYALFDSVAGLHPDLPVVRDYDACSYYKYDAGKLLVGAFEPNARPWATEGIPEDFCFDEIPGSLEHFEPILEQAMARVPALETAGLAKFFCGPESFTPDVRYHIGQAPEQDNCFVAAGLNSIGLQSAGGIGKVISEWIRLGHPPSDLWEVDVRRNLPFQRNRKYLRERVSESLGLLYAAHYPYRQYETARGVRKSPLYDRLHAIGACHGELAGWERPNWYAPQPELAHYEYSWGRQNWFECSAQEHRAVRERVGLFDQSSFAKFLVQGRDAVRVLNRVCANDVDVSPGRIVYTQWLNERGGIEADLTVTRLSEERCLVVTAAATEVRDFNWLQRHVPADCHCTLTNVTSAMGVISIMGPDSRALLQSLSPDDLSHEAFPFAHSREIELGHALVRASRITYVGELGWELYVPAEFAAGVYDAIVEAGPAFGLAHAGYHALDSLRIEKAYRHWGHDITDEDTPLEAGLGFAVRFDKPGGFIGREALLQQRQTGPAKRLLQFRLLDPKPLLYHDEPVWQGDTLVGRITSGAYGHTLGGAIGLGYVDTTKAPDPSAGEFSIEVAGERIPAEASFKPMYDPANKRIRC